MKIAVLAKNTRPIISTTHSGAEAFTYQLVEALVKRGHDVTLYASSDSHTAAKLISFVDSETARITINNENIARPYMMRTVRQVAQDAKNYDIIHNNLVHTYFLLPFSPFITQPIIHTMHNSLYEFSEWRRIFRLFGLQKNERMIFLSKRSQQIAGSPKQSDVIYNGIDTELFSFHRTGGAYCVWVGRMAEEKGPKQAILLAKATGVPLKLSSVPVTPSEQALSAEVEALVSSSISFVQEKTDAGKIRLYQQAKAFLFPLQFEEAFGLVTVEAMSCGTPVIAYARGSLPEIIEDGKTGFLVNFSEADKRGNWVVKQTGEAGMREAITRLYSLSEKEYLEMRLASRQRVKTLFSLQTMMDNYEKLYETMLGR